MTNKIYLFVSIILLLITLILGVMMLIFSIQMIGKLAVTSGFCLILFSTFGIVYVEEEKDAKSK